MPVRDVCISSLIFTMSLTVARSDDTSLAVSKAAAAIGDRASGVAAPVPASPAPLPSSAPSAAAWALAAHGPRSWVEYQCKQNMFLFFKCHAAGLKGKCENAHEISPALLEDLIKSGQLKMKPEHPGDGPLSLDRYVTDKHQMYLMMACNVHGPFEKLRDCLAGPAGISAEASTAWICVGDIAMALHAHDAAGAPFKGGSVTALAPQYAEYLRAQDPWRHDWIVDTVKGTVSSLGKDGKPGGTGDDADFVVRYR